MVHLLRTLAASREVTKSASHVLRFSIKSGGVDDVTGEGNMSSLTSSDQKQGLLACQMLGRDDWVRLALQAARDRRDISSVVDTRC